MATIHIEDELYGTFDYDSDIFTFDTENGLRYIRLVRDASDVILPEGIRILDGSVFPENTTFTKGLPKIPESVVCLQSLFCTGRHRGASVTVPVEIDELSIPMHTTDLFSTYSLDRVHIKHLHIRSGDFVKNGRFFLKSLPLSQPFFANNGVEIDEVTADPDVDVFGFFARLFQFDKVIIHNMPDMLPEITKKQATVKSLIEHLFDDDDKKQEFKKLYHASTSSRYGKHEKINFIYFDTDEGKILTVGSTPFRGKAGFTPNMPDFHFFISSKADYSLYKPGKGLVTKGYYPLTYDLPEPRTLNNVVILNPEETLAYLKLNRPSQYEWIMNGSSKFKPANMQRLKLSLLLPGVEILDKAGYSKLVEPLFKAYNFGTNAWKKLISDYIWAGIDLTQSNPAKIFYRIPKPFIKEFQTYSFDEAKDIFHKLGMTVDRTSKGIVYRTMKEMGITLRTFNTSVLSEPVFWSVLVQADNHGRPYFTAQSLVNYLNRIDTFEAIDNHEGLMLIYDYLNMCKQLDMKPRIDGDSLLREHDIAARLVTIQRTKAEEKEFHNAAELFKAYDYENSVFSVHVIDNQGWLLDKAKQQHNCVASYAHRIASGASIVFSMRSKHSPDKSLITIELDPRTLEVRQMYLAYNRRVTNPSQLVFIDRWATRNIKIKEGLDSAAIEEIPDVIEKIEEPVKKEAAAMAPVKVDFTRPEPAKQESFDGLPLFDLMKEAEGDKIEETNNHQL